MSNKKDWDPQLYLKYGNERTQPSIDLVSRIKLDNPANIIDIGCGPGNSTQVLAKRWPKGNIIGLDNSPSMIEKAKKDFPQQIWLVGDAVSYTSDKKFDLVFSNATIQWISDHEKLIPNLFNMLTKSGVLAVQIPKFNDMPLGKIIDSVSKQPNWQQLTAGCAELFTYHDASFYYNLLSTQAKTIDIWEASYFHIMPSHEAIIEWISSTGMKPYLDKLENEKQKVAFSKEVLSQIVKYYPAQANQKVLFPFKRLFFVVYR